MSVKLHQHPIYEDYFYNEDTHEIYREYLDQVIKPSIHSSGYYVFMAEDFVESTKKSYRLHRFIMECLLGREIKEGYVINHIDGDKGNNLPSNLEEVTISRNTKHAYENNLNGKYDLWDTFNYAKILIADKYYNYFTRENIKKFLRINRKLKKSLSKI